MYLSRLELNPRCRQVRHDLASPYELHRTLAHAFPTADGQDYRVTHGVLFRIEPLSHPAARQLVLVQSATAPDWQQLPEDYLCPPVQSKALTLTLTQGQVLGFRLVANPTKKARRDGQRQGRRLSLSDTATADGLTPAQQWLVRKGEQCGFELLQVRSEGFHLPSTRSASSRPSHFTKQQLPLYGVCFDGLLRVTDPDCLLETLRQGIGSAKAFGFGMLSLAPSAPLRS